jgi:hypothetical protein
MLCCSIAGILIANLLAMLRLRRPEPCAAEHGALMSLRLNWTTVGAGVATLGFAALGAIAITGAAPLGHICAFVVR